MANDSVSTCVTTYAPPVKPTTVQQPRRHLEVSNLRASLPKSAEVVQDTIPTFAPANPSTIHQPRHLLEVSKPRVKLLNTTNVAKDTTSNCAPPVKPYIINRPLHGPPVLNPRPELSRLKTQDISSSLMSGHSHSDSYPGNRQPARSNLSRPCDCLSVVAHSITDAAIHAAISYYTTHAASDGTQQPPIARWKNDLIRNHISKAEKQALNDVKAFTGLVVHSNHDAEERIRTQAANPDYSGHVQPWMNAHIHRGLNNAVIEAFKEIDERDGVNAYEESTQGLPFSFRLPGTDFSNPSMARFPCLCKDVVANSIADSVLATSVKTFSEEIPMLQQGNRARLRAYIAKATVHALEDIAEPEDTDHMCSAHGLAPHVKDWMKMRIYARCAAAASEGLKLIEWDRARTNGQKRHSTSEAGGEPRPITRQKVMPSSSSQPVTSAALVPHPESLSNPPTLTVHTERDTGKQVHAEKISTDAIYFALVSVKGLIPAENRKSAVRRMRTKLQPFINNAKDKALDAIARYESIVDESGDTDTARHLPLQEHGWMNAFLIHAINKAADAAAKRIRSEMQPAQVSGGPAVKPRTSAE